jgi:hypothetical protein
MAPVAPPCASANELSDASAITTIDDLRRDMLMASDEQFDSVEIFGSVRAEAPRKIILGVYH